MSDEYRTNNGEYHSPPPEEQSAVGVGGSATEYTPAAAEYATVSEEYTTPAPEYTPSSPEYWEETTEADSAKKADSKEKRHKYKNKMVYFTAGTVASFVVFSAALDGGLFGPGNSIVDGPAYEDTKDTDSELWPDIGYGDPDAEDDIGGGGDGGYGGSTEGSEGTTEDSELPNGEDKGKFIPYEYNILASNNYLIAFMNSQENIYGLMNYDGKILYSQTLNEIIGEVRGPNDMGYTTFYGFGDENLVEVVDATGKVVLRRTDGVYGAQSVHMGDSDVLYQYHNVEGTNAYITYTKVNGTVLFDSRKYTDEIIMGYPFYNGQALIVIERQGTDAEANRMMVLDYSGNLKEIPDVLGDNTSIFDTVDDYFVSWAGSVYSLIEVATGKVVGSVDLDAFGEKYNISNADMESYISQGQRYFHYGTKAVIAGQYLVDFTKMGADGLPTEVVKVDGSVEFFDREYLAVSSVGGVYGQHNYVDWEGNFLLDKNYTSTEPYNSAGYALAFDDAAELIYVVDENHDIIYTRKGTIHNTKYYGDFTFIQYSDPGFVRGYYYYGDQTAPNTKYTGPVARHAGSSLSEDAIPEVGKIALLPKDYKTDLKALSDQLQTLREAIAEQANSNITYDQELSDAVVEILTYSESLYYIACTDNATMTSYSKMEDNEKYTGLGLYYLQDMIDKYEQEGSFYTYFVNNYMGYHTGPPAEAVEKIYDNLTLISDLESRGGVMDNIQKYGMDVARELINVFLANNTNLEKLFNYMDEYATVHTDDTLFQNSYNKEAIDIITYRSMVEKLKTQGLRNYGTRTEAVE